MADFEIERIESREQLLPMLSALTKLAVKMHSESQYAGTTVCDKQYLGEHFLSVVDNGFVWTAKKGDKLVGFLCAKVSETYYGPNEIVSECGFYVRLKYRSSGVGKKLLAHAEAVAENLNATMCTGVSAGINNEEVSRLLVNLGYNQTGSLFEKDFIDVW